MITNVEEKNREKFPKINSTQNIKKKEKRKPIKINIDYMNEEKKCDKNYEIYILQRRVE